MKKIFFGATGIEIEKNGFGALPIQRVSLPEAVALLRRAAEGGMTFFDTARSYSDSEEKVGDAFAGLRDKVVIATKTHAQDAKTLWEHLHISLKNLRTDYIDLYQLHNPAFVPMPGDKSGLYDALVEAKKQGLIHHFGITNHNIAVAQQAIESGLYESLQFPYNYLSTPQELELPKRCAEKGMGFIAMKAMSGGLFVNGKAPFAFIEQAENVVPIWGVQHREELEEFLSFMQAPPALDEALRQVIAQDVAELKGSFCRGCGYCLPCPAGIAINNAARMSLMLRRAVASDWLTPHWQAEMEKIKDCIHCGQCSKKCPYGLTPPTLLQENYNDYQTFLAPKSQA